MIAKFDFIPAYCPNCGKKLFTSDAAHLETLRAIIDDYHNGVVITCTCGLDFQYDPNIFVIKRAEP